MNSSKNAKFVLWFLCMLLGLSGCAEMGELQKPPASPYYGALTPAANGEFRWANGDLPKTFDPAQAQTSSEIQAVRAAFDGLTEWDKQTLEAVPSLAIRWESSEDFRTWTFHLRPAAWSNGKRVTAQDFVRSWQRLKELGANSPHRQLISNVVVKQTSSSGSEISNSNENEKSVNSAVEKQTQKTTISDDEKLIQDPKSKVQNETWFGAKAIDDQTLRVDLISPDKDFPKLAAHSALRPISGEASEFERPEFATKIVTSGAFRFGSYDKTGVLLERSKNYWNAAAVKLERVRFVASKTAETALAAYRDGSIDALTNAHIEPLALKLLASYRDFERTTYNAVTFYEFNRTRPPFDDRRVREALAIALDRERLTNDELDGATFPAHSFLPNSVNIVFKFDPKRAQSLLSAAGFESGKEFPKIKLLINRNDASHRLAKAIAAQWKKNLNVETEIVVSSLDDLENSESTKDFDLVRRVVVLPTTDEAANLQAMFRRNKVADLESDINDAASSSSDAPVTASPTPNGFPIPLPTIEPIEDAPQIGEVLRPKDVNSPLSSDKSTAANQSENQSENLPENPSATQTAKQSLNLNEIILSETMLLPILSESQAFDEIPAIPLYFPSSYSLVKPYIKGFDTNLLDAPALRDVEIQLDWQRLQN